jgi:hypothetical protein
MYTVVDIYGSHPSLVIGCMRRRILVTGTALVVTMLTLSSGLIVVTMIWWLWVGIVWRIVVGMPWIMLRMLGMTVHWWRHTRMHVHVTCGGG